MKTKPLMKYIVWYRDGRSYDVWMPKMSDKRLRETLEIDAKADGSELASYCRSEGA